MCNSVKANNGISELIFLNIVQEIIFLHGVNYEKEYQRMALSKDQTSVAVG